MSRLPQTVIATLSSQSQTPLIPCFIAATPLVTNAEPSVPLKTFAPPRRIHVVRRRARARTSCTASGIDSPFDDEFFLAAEDIHLIKNNQTIGEDQARPSRTKDDNQRGKLTIAQRRTEEKRKELARASQKTVEDEDEIRRTQLAGEKLSASDLLGIVDGGSSSVQVTKNDAYSDDPELPPKPLRRKWTHPNAEIILGPDPTMQTKEGIRPDKLKQNTNSKLPPSKKRAPPSRKLQSRNPKSTMPQPPLPQSIRPSSPPLQPSETTVRPGNLVMHNRHGIGRFRGLERTVGSNTVFEEGSPPPVQEFAVIEYRDGDVYVPLSHFEALRRLSPSEVKNVRRLDTVSGSSSYSDKSNSTRMRRSRHIARIKTRSKIRKQLVNLHGLYAERASIEREPFPVDEEAERNFNATCTFNLTSDQQEATKQVFFDMSFRRQPMDRLLCGDVGFGKTEVAIRAAYRALRAGKQVAILAPTTILAQQHYETFQDRFQNVDEVRSIACLTRFMSRKSNLQSRQNIKDGLIRVAVGTHMLLGDSFEFQDLGLLIVDEEHRFGVNQKEKIRARYRAVDTLFLSATPIPRTLHLTLSGLRDASVLRIAPEGRKPVITRVAPSGAGVIREAIGQELERGGQIFFVVPRIEGIEASANLIRDLFPNIRVLVAHGSMSDLERRIWSFAQREYDVLVCTTIIENGINMPDVNTVVIENASRFGLAQLHQLRGRVGRSDIQAYAWLLYSQTMGGNTLPAFERLKVLEKNSNLGSGFVIAQRDMEMRGVGTILGVEQHGNSSIDAEEYAKMLSEELEHARTGKPIPVTLPKVDACLVFLPVPSFIPSEYIPDFDQKITAYSYLSNAESMKTLYCITKDIELRYGPMPSATRKHVHVLELRLRGRELGVSRIFTERQHVILDWQVEEAAFNCLVAFLPEKQARSRFQLVAEEERVVVRGLGICSGDVQLAKLRSYFSSFAKAAQGFHRTNPDKEEKAGLANSLSEIAASEKNSTDL